MGQTIKNNGGNRALVVYSYGENVELEAFDDAVFDGFGDVAVIDSELEETTIDTPRTVAINLSSGTWARALKIGNCGGNLIVGIYFYNQPDQPKPEIVFVPTDELGNPIGEPEYEEPEPPSITSLVCNALQEAFGGVYGASAFVIPNTVTEFTLEVE